MRSERWSTSSEIRKAFTHSSDNSQGGPILDYHNNGYSKYVGEGHSLICGSTGCGKSRRQIIPMAIDMIRAKESMIFADSKGEIHDSTAHLLSKEYKKIVIDFRNIWNSAGCNILALITHLYCSGNDEYKQVAMELLDHLATALYPVSQKDPFWDRSSQSVFTGAVVALMECAPPEAVTIANVFQLVTRGDERFGGPGNTYLKELVSMMPPDSTAAMELNSFTTTASETALGIKSSFLQPLSPFIRSAKLIEMMSNDDLKIHELDDETPVAIYLILPDESATYDQICGSIVNMLLTWYIRLAQRKDNKRLARRLNVVLDEFANIAHAVPNLPHLLSAGRSRGIRCHICLQSLAQLNDIYGPAKAAAIRDNMSLIVAFRGNNWETLSELSRMCGEREVERNGHYIREPLITPSDLSAMQVGQALVMLSGGIKFVTWLPDFTEIFGCSNANPHTKLPRPSRKPPVRFDIQEFVKQAKRKKIDEMMNQQDSNQQVFPSPFASSGSSTSKSDSSFSIDKLIAKIDAKIAEISEQEEDEDYPKAKGTAPYGVTLTGYNSSLSVIRVLQKLLGLEMKDAYEITRRLPYTKRFATLKEASAFSAALANAGGTVTNIGF